MLVPEPGTTARIADAHGSDCLNKGSEATQLAASPVSNDHLYPQEASEDRN